MYNKQYMYKIPIQRLTEGVHTIEIEIEKEFIEQQKIEEMHDIQVHVVVVFTKRLQLHTMQITMRGRVFVPCDRCLETVEIPITNTQTFVVKQALIADELAEADDVILYSQDDLELDISHILYENIVLSLPLKKVHDEKKCNTLITSYISKKNKEQTIDPRWESLKNIFKN